MAGRGPAPKPIEKRAGHSPNNSVPMRILPRLLADQPELPEFLVESDGVLVPFRWPDQTRDWWQMWRDSPLSVDFTSTDWSELLDSAQVARRRTRAHPTQASETRPESQASKASEARNPFQFVR